MAYNEDTCFTSRDLYIMTTMFLYSESHARKLFRENGSYLAEVIRVIASGTLSRKEIRFYIFHVTTLADDVKDSLWNRYINYTLAGKHISDKEFLRVSEELYGDHNNWEEYYEGKI